MRCELMIITAVAIAAFVLSFHIFYLKKEFMNPIINFRNEVKYLFNYPENLSDFARIFEDVYNVSISIAYCDGTRYYNYTAIVKRCEPNKPFVVNLTKCNVEVSAGPPLITFLNFKKPIICYCIIYKNLIDLKCV